MRWYGVHHGNRQDTSLEATELPSAQAIQVFLVMQNHGYEGDSVHSAWLSREAALAEKRRLNGDWCRSNCKPDDAYCGCDFLVDEVPLRAEASRALSHLDVPHGGCAATQKAVRP